MHVRCPHCHNPIEIIDEVEMSDIPCPSCGSSFSLLDDKTKSYDPKTKTIGHFELVDQIGVGAFGSVWMARDTKLDRTVAIKIPRKEQLDPEDIEKFFREARAAAQLQHPNIVSIHEVGRDGDSVYIVSDLIKGLSLSDWLSGQKLTPKEAAELCAKMAEALDHAHKAGIIHRDLKPSNIMLDGDGEPHIMDFGLAKREVGEITMTMDGKILGTPAYMSPEQAMGDAHSADRRSDVYSLGVVLFELLTEELPFRGNSRMLIHQVINQGAPSPRSLNSNVPRDLETICLKCLEKEPQKRYGSAQALADDLGRAVKGEPIHARASSRVEKAVRWCKREPAKATAIFAVLLIPIITTTLLIRLTVVIRQNAVSRVDTLLNAAPSTIPLILQDLDRQASVVGSRLNQLKSEALLPSQRLRLSLALLPSDAIQLQYLTERLNDCSYEELAVVLDRVKQNNGADVTAGLWTIFHNLAASPNDRFRAGIALAALDPKSEEWSEKDYKYITSSLLQEITVYQPAIRQSLRPIAEELLDPISMAFVREDSNQTVLESAATAIVDFYGGDAELLADLSMRATPKQHSILFPRVSLHAESNETIIERFVEVTQQQPRVDFDEIRRVALGRRRAGAAINLVRMGNLDESLEVLRVKNDPESLTQFVHGCKDRGVTVTQLLDLLNRATSASERYGILLALGEFKLSEIPEDIRSTWLDYLKDLYANDPSSGVHGASGWILRHWGQEERTREVDETSIPYSSHREWFNLVVKHPNFSRTETTSDQDLKISYTFIVHPSGEYQIGALVGDRFQDEDETRREVKITTPFAVLDREVTFAELCEFEERFVHDMQSFGFDPECAGFQVSWYDAVRFCRWLTLKMGISESEQSYADPSTLDRDEYYPEPERTAKGAPRNWPVDIHKRGLRLPTEAEWEIACRAGSVNVYSFGGDASLLRHYGWMQEFTTSAIEPKLLRPSIRGLFDMHGNLSEWCHDWRHSDSRTVVSFKMDQIDPMGPEKSDLRHLRGGGWSSRPPQCRSANRAGIPPVTRSSSIGLRLVMNLGSSSMD